MKKTLRLGTRGSPLALIQAEDIRQRLIKAHPVLAHDYTIDIIPIRTTGDWKPEHQERRFVDMGGNKGLFTKEIEEALYGGYIDMAVHSMKDVASTLPDGLTIAAVTERQNPCDAFICASASSLDGLPAGAVIGTASLRRQAQILHQRPDLRTTPLRGNVETRLKKLADGLVDATFLAVAGLARLGMESRITAIMAPNNMIPAAAQGALGIETRRDDEATRAWLQPLNHAASFVCVSAERAVMRAIDGSCHTPAGAYAVMTASGQIALDAFVARANGGDMARLAATGAPDQAEDLGDMIGRKLRERSPADLFAA